MKKPKCIGLAKAPYASLEKFIEILEKHNYLVIKLDYVALEIFKEQLKMPIAEEELYLKKNMIWEIFGKSYLAEKAVLDWMPWVESYAEVEPGRFQYAITDIETPEEVNYLRMKFGDDFKLIAVSPPRSIRLARFKNQMKMSEADFIKLEKEIGNRGLAKVIMQAEIIAVTDDDEKEILKIFENLWA